MESSKDLFSRIIHYDEHKNIQIRLGINEFRDVEYMYLRKYYEDFEGEWKPSNEGVNFPLTISNSKELFAGLVEILSLAENKELIAENFKEILEVIYQ